ncbi:MAG: hypothetical protein AAFQ69_18775 [Pseudomonadota bacterium]
MTEDEGGQKTTEEEPPAQKNTIKLSAPWGTRQSISQNIAYSVDDAKTAQAFLRQRTGLHKEYIVQIQKNKRLGMILAFVMIVFSILILIFAPEGRETLSYWTGAALIIFAAGALGYGRVWGKAGSISFGADQDKRPME